MIHDTKAGRQERMALWGIFDLYSKSGPFAFWERIGNLGLGRKKKATR